jgi:hypothetical protein
MSPRSNSPDAALREADSLDHGRRAFYATPPGQARAAFHRGDDAFQYVLDVQSADPNAVLNAICREGWELISGSFVALRTMPSATAPFSTNGVTRTRAAGCYLFRRSEANRRDSADPF